METTSLAYVFNSPPPDSDEELYPFPLQDEHDELPLSPGDQALLMGVYPATMSDFDFNATIHAASPPPAHGGSVSPMPNLHDLNISTALPPSTSSMGSPSEYEFDARSLQAFKKKTGRRTGSSSAGSASGSPMSNPESDMLRDSEEILNAPVKSLTEEEKKLRRRAQVAKSARKHRNRQKEELARLREQVMLLQEQMAKMKPHDGGESAEAIKMEHDVITQHRKRKKVDDEPDLTMTCDALASPTSRAISLGAAEAAGAHIQHWFSRLPVDTLERIKRCHQIADKRMQLAPFYLEHEFGSRVVRYPQYDIKLNSNGPDMEIKLLRAKEVPGYTHQEIGNAAWNSIFNFEFDLPERFKPHVKCDRFMELDENTRYGRTIVPLLKNADNQIVYVHSYFVVRRKCTDAYTMITWEAIAADDLHPFETTDTALLNDEVGCTVFETTVLPTGQPLSHFRTIIHCTPPVNAIMEPRGKLNEAFLTVFCRNADIVERSARNIMRRTYPGRQEQILK
ncbi:hypothetical protein PybrP1_005325 [[Pythium] brassicae (nom. inval.)]|nr:hypothetical protein PybrP1_005325 [[Pythium] brassicae (nom. inval.)]